MALTGKPVTAKHIWGSTVYFLNPSLGTVQSGVIEKIVADVSNPSNDANGVQTTLYYLTGISQPFDESKVFHSKNALLYSLKGAYLNTFVGSVGLGDLQADSDNDFSYSNFAGCDFTTTAELPGAILDGCNFTGASLAGVSLSGASCRNANFTNAVLTTVTFTNADFRGADLTGATMSAAADTKAEFKALVGAGNYDPLRTIWTDGTAIGA